MAETTDQQVQDKGPQQIDTPPYPGTTKIDNGQAFDVAGKPLGAVDESGKPISAPTQAVPASGFNFGFKPTAAPAQAAPAASASPASGFDFGFKPVEQKPENAAYTSLKKFASAFNLTLTGTESGEDLRKKVSDIVQSQPPGWAKNLSPELQGYAKLGAAAVGLGKSVIDAQQHEMNTGISQMQQPGILNKASGAVRYLQGIVPLAGPALGAIEDHFAKGEYAEGLGTAAALLIPGAAEHFGPGLVESAQSAAGRLAVNDTKALLQATKNQEAAAVMYDGRLKEHATAVQQVKDAEGQADATREAQIAGKATKEQADAAASNASAARANLTRAEAAVTEAKEAHANASLSVEQRTRQVQRKLQKIADVQAEKVKENGPKSMELMKKAIPAKGSDFYTVDEKTGTAPKYDIVRSHLEAAKEAGVPIDNIQDARNVAEEARQGIEDKVMRYTDKYDAEPLTNESADTKLEDSKSPKNIATRKLQEMSAVDGNFEGAEDYLNDFNVTDPTVGEAKETLTKLNDHLRQMKKSSNNWDIYNQIETNPKFAAYYFLADELRDSLYSKFESHGVEGIREARGETAALVDFRNMADAQTRANRGGTKVRGSGSQSRMRNLIAKLTGKAIKGAGIAVGAEMGGPAGAVGGGAVGEMIGEPVQNYIAPGDLTRDEHIAKSMKQKGTLRKPVEIKGEGTEPVIPKEPIPPAPKDVGPEPLQLTPRENTDLHADLAAHYGITDLDSTSYQELEQDLRDDIETKRNLGMKPDAKEQALLNKVLKADAADRGIRAAANKPTPTLPAEAEADLLKDAQAKADGKPKAELNPELVNKGQGEDSLLVSHSPAMKATAKPLDIAGLPEGMTSEDAHLHEWAHTAIGAVDGLEPVEIRTDLHPKSKKGASATAVFNAASIRDAAGNVDPELLGQQEVQWLTQKMAGPASHEVFKGMPREDVENSPATRGDFRDARAIVREVHPDFTSKQVSEVVSAAYDRARDFLTKPHIADRIRANAAVREEGLAQTLHASHGRVNKFAEDIRNAHTEYTGNDAGPNGGGAGEGGEKAEKPAAEGEEKNAGRDQAGKREVAPEPVSESATARGVAESEIRKTPEQQFKQKFKIEVTTDGESKVEPVEAFSRKEAFQIAQKKFPQAQEFQLAREEGEGLPRQEGYVVPEEKHLNTPNSREGLVPVEKTMKHELGHFMVGHNEGMSAVGVMRHTHPNMPRFANAAIHWDTSDMVDSTGRKYKAEKIPSLLRMAMGGVAADEVFSNIPRYQNNNFSPRVGSGDGMLATRILRAAGYQEPEITQMIHTAVDQAKEHLTKPAVSDIINENAGVREPGLSRQYHYSGERLRAMGEEAARRLADERNNRAGAGEGGEAGRGDVAGREGQAAGALGQRVEASPISKTVPPERTTGDAADDAAIKAGGGVPGGRMTLDANTHVRMFHDPQTGTTLGFSAQEKVTPEATKAKLAASRKAYGLETEQSAIDKDPFEKAVAHYGTTDDINKAGYIGKDGRMLDFSDGQKARVLDHGDIATVTGESQTPRQSFVADTGAVRILKSRNYVGVQFDAAHPPTAAQLRQLEPWLADKPQVEFEVSDKEGEGRRGGSAMGKPESIEDMQQLVKDARLDAVRRRSQNLAVEQSNISKKVAEPSDEQVAAHEANGGSTFTPEGENLAGKDLYSVGAHPDRTLQVDKLTPEVLEKFKADNADLLKDGEHAVGTWKDSDTGKTVLDITKLHTDRDEAVAAGKVANQKAIYHLGGEGEIPTGGTGEGPLNVEQSDIKKSMPEGTKLDDEWQQFGPKIRKLTARDIDGNDVGHITVERPNKSTAFIAQSTVDEPQRGKGIGENLYRAAIEDARKSGAIKLQSDTKSRGVSDDAQRVWQKLAKSGDYNISQDANGRWTVDLTKPNVEQSELKKSPKGSSVPLMDNPLPVKGTMKGEEVGTLDVTKALNQFSRKSNPALEPGSEPKEMVDRAKKIAEDEAKYQLAQSKTGTEWYTTEMKDHDKLLQELRPELAEGETTSGTDGHPVNLTLFKAAEAILSSGQKPYANVKSALRLWDLYKETGEFPRQNPTTGKSWGPRGINAYGSAFDSLNRLIKEKGEKGAADWLLSEHPVKELRSYQAPGQTPVKGKAADMETGAMILGAKRGPFMQNLHGIESKFTADMWVSRTWNRWMGTLDLDPRIEEKGKMNSVSDSPRNNTERALMKESFSKTADKLGLTTSSLQAVLWYYEQALYRAHGLPVESWSFSDAAKRVAKEAKAGEAEQTGFNFGENAKEKGGADALAGLVGSRPKFDALGRPYGRPDLNPK